MNNIDGLREVLFAQLRELRAASGADDVRAAVVKAKAVSELSQTIIDSARVQVDYLRATGGDSTAPFFDALPNSGQLPAGITGIRQHRIAG